MLVVGGLDSPPENTQDESESMFDLLKCQHSFHSELSMDNCKFHIIKDKRVVSKMEGKTNFSRRLQAVSNRDC